MSKRGTLIAIFILLAHWVNAQTRLTGKVTDSATLAPLANVSVYIANTTIGTITDKDGGYSLSDLHPGRYQLVVSSVGYSTKVAEINAGEGEHTINIALSIKATALKEIIIGTHDWQYNLGLFKYEFLGTNNKQDCKILNEDILDLNFKNNRLTASTDDFLDIQNTLLGYKLRFLVKEFWVDYTTKKCHYLGSAIFEPMHGSPKDEKRWAKNRLAIYNTSFRHFLVSASRNQATDDGFVMRKMTREPDQTRPPDDIIKQKIAFFAAHYRTRHAPDSLYKWNKILRTPKIASRLAPGLLHEGDIIKPGPQPGTFSLQFADYLYVIYKKKKVDLDFDNLMRFREAADYQIACVALKNDKQPTLFDSRGILLSRESLYYEGAWNNWIVSLLPSDYEPEQE